MSDQFLIGRKPCGCASRVAVLDSDTDYAMIGRWQKDGCAIETVDRDTMLREVHRCVHLKPTGPAKKSGGK